MPLINWSPAFSVNVKDMDAEHQILIDIINQLHDSMRSGKATQETGEILNRMVEYTQRHFKAEEKILLANNYPQYQRQKSEHDAFIAKTLEYKRDFQQGKLALSVQVSSFLKVWWTDHIQKEDKQYGVFLNSRGLA
jgi:hemerythrin